MGSTWTFVRLGTSPAGRIWTTSPNLTLRFLRTTLFILILPSSSLLSIKATTRVSFLFFPFMKIASPLKILSSDIFAWDNWIEEFSSLVAYSTYRHITSTSSLLGAFFWSRIAVETSFLGSIKLILKYFKKIIIWMLILIIYHKY